MLPSIFHRSVNTAGGGRNLGGGMSAVANGAAAQGGGVQGVANMNI